jgi:hypothetical protein
MARKGRNIKIKLKSNQDGAEKFPDYVKVTEELVSDGGSNLDALNPDESGPVFSSNNSNSEYVSVSRKIPSVQHLCVETSTTKSEEICY